MPQRIIYQTNEGGVAILVPTGELSIEEVARKDVPAGARYAIINTADVPTDRTFRSAWEVEHGDLNDGIGIGQNAWFIEQYQAELAAINAETEPELVLEPTKAIEEIAFPEDMPVPEQMIVYGDYVESVAAENQRRTEAHTEAVAKWEASKTARIAQLNTQIATQQAEMNA